MHEKNPSQRKISRKKTTRSHHPVRPPFRWNEARRTALALLDEYYLLRVKDFPAILKGIDNENSRRATQNVLAALCEEQYVGRKRFIDDMAEKPTVVYAYYLNDSGAKLLANPRAALAPESMAILRHEIEITQFHIRLKKFAESRGLTLQWHQPKIDHRRDINPDAYFGIKDPKLPEGKNTLHYFLEVERAKVGNYKNGEPSIIRKLAKYYEFYDSPHCEKEWGFRKFRTIVVVRTADKQYNLCERLADKYPHRMFWITTEPHVAEGIGGEIFKTPKDWTKVGYSLRN
jgi:hypothetical protein